MVALSDSSVTSGSSAFTVSPGLTSMPITGTSLKSPMSGTLTSSSELISWCPYTVIGFGLFGSRPYFAMASATLALSICPSSASAFSAATVT